MTRATVSIYVTNRTLRSRILQLLFGLVSDSKLLQRWFASVVWTSPRSPKTRWPSSHRKTKPVARRPSRLGTGWSKDKPTIRSTRAAKSQGDTRRAPHNEVLFLFSIFSFPSIRCSPPLCFVDYYASLTALSLLRKTIL